MKQFYYFHCLCLPSQKDPLLPERICSSPFKELHPSEKDTIIHVCHISGKKAGGLYVCMCVGDIEAGPFISIILVG